MKKEIRLIGIDDSPFDKCQKPKVFEHTGNSRNFQVFKGNNVLVVGTVFRGGSWLDGVLSTKVKVDGTNATSKVIEMINKCKFKPQIHAILLNGIALGGFNIIDIKKLNKKTKLPVIVVIRNYPNFDSIKKALKKMKKESRFNLIKKAGEVIKVGKVYIQLAGISLEDAKEILKISCTRSFIPEPIRIAHIIASGIVTGESKGNA